MIGDGILLVEDQDSARAMFARYLANLGYEVTGARTLAEAKGAVREHLPRGILLDLGLPDGNSLDWIPHLKKEYPAMGIIVITGIGDIPTAVEAMRRGADHFMTKPVDLQELEVFLEKSLDVGGLRRQHLIHRRLAKESALFWPHSPLYQKVREFAEMAASNDLPVLLLGETGTGKGVLARFIHERSPRKGGPFVELNCSAIRGDLLASELFGHSRGAFTSADRDREGLLDAADGATLFLDEIGDMGLEIQARFLKVIEEKRYRRLGDNRERRSDFRLICATNKDLSLAVQAEQFRHDLFFRIHVFPVTIPPVRDYLDDLVDLVDHLLAEMGARGTKLAGGTLERMRGYAWPGNVRELKNVLSRALVLAQGRAIGPEHIPGLDAGADSPPGRSPSRRPPGSGEKDILAALDRSGGDTLVAAEALGISRATLYRRMRAFGLKPPTRAGR